MGSTLTPELAESGFVVVVVTEDSFDISAGVERIWELINTKASTIERSAKSQPAKLLFCRRIDFVMYDFYS